MLKDIKKYKRLGDVINIHETEVWLSLLISFGLCIVLKLLNLYEDFASFIDLLSEMVSCFIGGYLGIIGFALSGMSIMLGMFSKKQIDVIEKCNGKGVIEEIMSSYSFLAFVSAINIIVLLAVSFSFSSSVPILPQTPFWIVVFLILYLSLFNIFYAVALVFNCISLFVIYKLYSAEKEDEVLPIANEVRIDYILGILIQVCKLSRSDVLKALDEEASSLSEEMRHVLKDYFEKHYKKE